MEEGERPNHGVSPRPGRAGLLSLLTLLASGCASGGAQPGPGLSPSPPDAVGPADAAVTPVTGRAPDTTAPPDAAGAVSGADGSAAPGDGDGAAAQSGLVKIFDGNGFDNWVYDTNAWKIVDRAMVGKVAGGQSQAFTKVDYSNFRLIVWSRMVNGNDHLGVCFWGARPAAGKYGFGGCLLVIPPNGAIWDYLTNTDNPKPNYQVGMADWHKTEILANRTTGRVQVAVNGKLVHDYQDPAAKIPRRKAGPIGMQIHKAGTESEYRDIEIEVDPKSDKLLTLTP
jgi:hypothetical protein